jgi:hypothetical protein
MSIKEITVAPEISDENIAITKWRTSLLKAIKERNVSEVKSLVDDPPGDITQLLSEPLTEPPPGPCRAADNGRSQFRFTLPIILAAMHGEVETLDIFFTKGADLYAADWRGENIIHALCWAAGYRPKCEASLGIVYKRIIELAATIENKRKLLYAEDEDSLRPVELASSFGNFLIMNNIFETVGIYKFILSDSPVGQVVQYDLTDYESRGPERRRNTPLNFIRRTYEGDLEKEGALEILESPILQEWVGRKFKNCIPVIAMEFIVSLILIFGFTIMDDYGHDLSCSRNVTSFEMPRSMKFATFYFSVAFDLIYSFFAYLALFRGVWKLYRLNHLKHLQRPPDIQAKGKILVSRFLFIGFYTLRTLLVIFYLVFDVAWSDWREWQLGSSIMLSLRVAIQVQMWWGMLYYIQLLPGIGHLVIAAFRCFAVFLYFIVILLIFFIASAEGIRSVARYYCLGTIGYGHDSYYSTFLMMLNMISPRDLLDQSTPMAMVLMHFHVVFIVVILLLNFLIALLSEEVGKIEGSKHVIQTITKCNVCIETDLMYDGISELIPDCLKGDKEERFVIEWEEYSV